VGLSSTAQTNPFEDAETNFIFGNHDSLAPNVSATSDQTSSASGKGEAVASPPNLPNLSQNSALVTGQAASGMSLGGLSVTTWLLIIGAAVIAGLIVKKT